MSGFMTSLPHCFRSLQSPRSLCRIERPAWPRDPLLVSSFTSSSQSEGDVIKRLRILSTGLFGTRRAVLTVAATQLQPTRAQAETPSPTQAVPGRSGPEDFRQDGRDFSF